MQIQVLIEPVAGNGYRAVAALPFGESAEGATPDEKEKGDADLFLPNFLRQARRPEDVVRAYDRLAEAAEFLAGWRILRYSQQAIARVAQLKAARLNVRMMDLRIAAIALEHGGIVVTCNLRDFQRVPGLTVENWAV